MHSDFEPLSHSHELQQAYNDKKFHDRSDEYHRLELIGEGSYGKVYKGRRKFAGQIVAMKFIIKAGKVERDLRNLRQVSGNCFPVFLNCWAGNIHLTHFASREHHFTFGLV